MLHFDSSVFNFEVQLLGSINLRFKIHIEVSHIRLWLGFNRSLYLPSPIYMQTEIYPPPLHIPIYSAPCLLKDGYTGVRRTNLPLLTHPLLNWKRKRKRNEELGDRPFPSHTCWSSAVIGIQCLAGQFLAWCILFPSNLLMLLPAKISPLLHMKITESKLREQLAWIYIYSSDYLFKETDIFLLSNLQLA